MHRKLDMTRARSRSTTALTVTTLIACTTLVAGCSDDAPTPDDQRDQMLSTTQTVLEELTGPLQLTDVTVRDDATALVPCPQDGERFEYVVDAVTSKFNADDDDVTLDGVGTAIYGVLQDVPAVEVLTDVDDNWSDPDWDGHSRIAFSADHGAAKGMEVVFDLDVGANGSVEATVTGATACG